jgi:outer membrane lipoprotein-sorting protein
MFNLMRPLVRAIIVFGIMSAGMTAYADPITDAENWFNQIKTLKGRFIQISDDGAYAEGDVYLKRPYWSRFDYDEPLETVLITTKIWLHVDEQDQEKLTSYPISETPLGILFSENVKLSLDGISTTATTKDGVVRIALDKPTGDDAGMLVLEFSEKPFELRRWIITDSAGVQTVVAFQNLEKDMALSQRLFVPPNYQQ